MQIAKEEGFVSDDEIGQNPKDKKSAIVLDKRIVYSPISSVTLLKRANFVKNLK